MSEAELRAYSLFNSLHLESTDDEVRRHLMVLLLTAPSVANAGEVNTNNKKSALSRLAGCITLPDDFDYKASLAEAIDAKYL